MVEKAVVYASIITTSLALLGFGILTWAHYENPGYGGRFRFALKLLETTYKDLEGEYSEHSKEIVLPNLHFVFFLLMFVGALCSNSSQSCEENEKQNDETVEKMQKMNKNRKKIKKRRTSMRKRGKKRFRRF